MEGCVNYAEGQKSKKQLVIKFSSDLNKDEIEDMIDQGS